MMPVRGRFTVVGPNAKRMKKLTLIFLSLIIHSVSYSQSYSDLMTDSVIHEFIELNKRYLGGRKLDSKIIDWQKCDLFKDYKNCVIVDFIQANSDSIITDKLLSEFQTLYQSIDENKPDSFPILSDKQKKGKYDQVSVPLISSDGKTAIIKVRYWCGDECGSGGILIFKKNKNKWTKVGKRSTWIS